jgi:hypothetical protein
MHHQNSMNKNHRPHVHICIVSKQAQPNVIPILIEVPDYYLLACSQRSISDRWDEPIMKALGPNFKRISCEPTPSLNPGLVYKYGLALFQTLVENGCRVTLNLTGGTKLQTLGFYQAFQSLVSSPSCNDWRAIYCNSALNGLDVLWPESQTRIPIDSVLTVTQHLACQGVYRFVPQPVARMTSQQIAYAAAARRLAVEDSDSLSRINKLSHAASEMGSLTQRLDKEPSQALIGLLSAASSLGLSSSTTDACMLAFADRSSARYLCSEWLEHYLHDLLVAKFGAANVLFNVRMLLHGVDNQIDVILFWKGRLFIFECKASKMGDEQAINYKLDSIGKTTAGLFGAAMLVSARTLTDVDALSKRARQNRVGVLSGSQIDNVEHIEAWVEAICSDEVEQETTTPWKVAFELPRAPVARCAEGAIVSGRVTSNHFDKSMVAFESGNAVIRPALREKIGAAVRIRLQAQLKDGNWAAQLIKQR